jgi:ABC-2 type transport system ATP-binding protein
MIRVENLTKEFGDVRAIDRLSFEVFEGEILGFLGPNGAGKTTTMRILTCFFPPTSGRATVAGFDVVSDPDEVRRVIGYMPEGVPLYREMKVLDALDFVAHAKGFGRAERRRVVDGALGETGLGDVRNRIIGHLSKGYRQRVGLAQAILGDPKVLILDEPTVGLDPRQITEIRNLIHSMAGRRTVILSTHILPEVQITCSRVVIINRGRIAASGTPEKLTTDMQGDMQTRARILGPIDSVMAALEDIAGVLSVQRVGAPPPDVPQEYSVVARRGAESPHSAIARQVVQNGWQLLELHQVGMTLEDIFLKVIAGEAAEVDARASMDAPPEGEGAA